ncbi:MAG TPA: hypothetical protein DCX53_06085, partial [Anaerolineae bacterium]|nr:hypothetical protein [Anaerolineae bacterium]
MNAFFGKLLTPPEFPDKEEKDRAARYGYWITLVFIAIIILYETVGRAASGFEKLNILDYSLITLLAILYIILRMIRTGLVSQA